MTSTARPRPADLDRKLALELVRATEAAAIAASRHLGRCDKEQVDPVDGTTLTAKSLPNALSIVAVAERHTMFDPGPCV